MLTAYEEMTYLKNFARVEKRFLASEQSLEGRPSLRWGLWTARLSIFNRNAPGSLPTDILEYGIEKLASLLGGESRDRAIYGRVVARLEQHDHVPKIADSDTVTSYASLGGIHIHLESAALDDSVYLACKL